MARVRVLYWKEIPVQVQAEDDDGRVPCRLEDRFQQGVDTIAMFDGSSGNDQYLDAWEWGKYREVAGSARAVSQRVAEQYNRGFPGNFVERIRRLHQSGKRDPRPGAVDHWITSSE